MPWRTHPPCRSPSKCPVRARVAPGRQGEGTGGLAWRQPPPHGRALPRRNKAPSPPPAGGRPGPPPPTPQRPTACRRRRVQFIGTMGTRGLCPLASSPSGRHPPPSRTVHRAPCWEGDGHDSRGTGGGGSAAHLFLSRVLLHRAVEVPASLPWCPTPRPPPCCSPPKTPHVHTVPTVRGRHARIDPFDGRPFHQKKRVEGSQHPHPPVRTARGRPPPHTFCLCSDQAWDATACPRHIR